MRFDIEPIGHVRAARKAAEDDFWGDTRSIIELVDSLGPESLQGLLDFSHVEVIFLFDKVDSSRIVTGARHPRNNESWPKIGIFAQRGKNRPNRIGSTICRIASIDDRRLTVEELDAIDGTPVVDLKPVMSEFLPRTPVSQPAWSIELMERYWDEADT
ncbi:MAG: SAM-dependent methyltransferase [Pseudomonadales bacterium]|nr:SAM-dependent methyltransferase [Pseudomonadales bacterium]